MSVKVLIIKLSSIGDIVHTLPALNALKSTCPELEIDWLVYEKFSSLLNKQSAINEIKVLPDKKLTTLYDTIRYLQQEKYDLVIDFQGLIKTALISKFTAKKSFGFANPREKIASYLYDHKLDLGDTLNNNIHVLEQNLKLANFVSKQVLNREIGSEIDFGKLGYNFFTETKKRNSYEKLCIIPSTTWQSKFWIAEYWAELLAIMKQKYQSEIYITGTEADLPRIEEIISHLKVPFHLVLGKSLEEIADFYREMNIIIGVDTGPLHIAAATAYPQEKSGKKIIGLYGPTSGSRTGPYGFENLSFDEIYQTKASHKRSIDEDGASMKFIKPEHVLSLID